MPNPVIAEVIRGPIAESRHTGSFAIVDRSGQVVAQAGDITVPVYPRSAIKAFQCLPVIESGAADAFGFSDEEIALACSSHNGEAEHVRVARSMLAKAGNGEADYECGAHWPMDKQAQFDAIRTNDKPLPVHNNCSGKHAGMLAVSRRLGAESAGYVGPEHPVQRAISQAMSDICDCQLDHAPRAVDGCSVPTWAMPLRNMSLGLARLTDPAHKAGARIINAVRANPFMVAGTKRFDTRIMEALPRLFTKGGAEGVQCACVPHAGLGIAIKCDDGAGRAGEVALAAILSDLDIWMPEEKAILKGFLHHDMANWRHIHVGEVRAVPA